MTSLIRDSWSLDLIPLSNATMDYSVRNFIVFKSGSIMLGQYQTITGIEATIANVFLGPYYRKVLLEVTRSKEKTIINISKTILKGALISGVPFLGFIFLSLLKSSLPLRSDLLQVIYPLVAVSSFGILWAIWGVFGQILLAYKFTLLVSKVEVTSRILTGLLLILCLYFFNFGLCSYVIVIAKGVISIFLMIVIWKCFCYTFNNFLKISKVIKTRRNNILEVNK